MITSTPGTASPQALLSALHWRYAVKAFDPMRFIPAPVWNALEEALILAPSSGGLQPWKFFVVDDPALRARLREASYGQPQITDAARLVVFASKTGFGEADIDRHIARVAEVRGLPIESLAGLKGMAMGIAARPEEARDIWSARQTYIALGNFVAAAAMLGVDACPMEGIDNAQYDVILGLREQGYTALAVVAVGYRAAEDRFAGAAKVRFPKSEIVVHV